MGKHEEMRTKTRAAIQEAFWQLYKERDIRRITVREVIALGGVNRTTFYRYYPDVYRILEEIEEKLLQKTGGLISGSVVSEGDMDQFLQKAYELYQEDREYLHVLVRERKDSQFAEKYCRVLQEMLPVVFMRDGSAVVDKDLEASLELYTYGVVEVFIKWADDNRLSFEKLKDLLKGVSLEGMYPMLLRVYQIRPLFSFEERGNHVTGI